MAARTIRVFWRNKMRGWLNFNWDGVIFPDSVVHVSVCEAKFIEGVAEPVRWRGGAAISVENIRPHGPNPGDTITGGVEFLVDIEWDSPLDIATDITVLDFPDLTFIA